MDRVVRLKIIFFGHHINIISPLKNKIMKGKKKRKKKDKDIKFTNNNTPQFFFAKNCVFTCIRLSDVCWPPWWTKRLNYMKGEMSCLLATAIRWPLYMGQILTSPSLPCTEDAEDTEDTKLHLYFVFLLSVRTLHFVSTVVSRLGVETHENQVKTLA